MNIMLHYREGKSFDLEEWGQILLFNISLYIWPFTVIPGLLYTWQSYDMVEEAVNPEGKRYSFCLGAIFVAITTLGTLIATGM
jgi:hypothetical protein